MKRLIVLIFAGLFLFYVAWPALSGYQIHGALQAKDTATLSQKIDFPSVRQSMRGPVLDYAEERMAAVIKQYGPLAEWFGSYVPKDKIAGYVDTALEDVVNPDGLVRVYEEGGDVSVEIQRSIMRQINEQGGILSFFRRSRQGGGDTSAAAGTNRDAGPETAANGGGDERRGLPGGIELPGAVGDLVGGAAGEIAGSVAGDVADRVVGEVADRISNLDAQEVAEALFPKLAKAQRRSASRAPGGDGGSSFGFGNIKKFGFAGPLGLQLGVAGSTEATDPDVTAQIDFENYDWRVTKLTPNL